MNVLEPMDCFWVAIKAAYDYVSIFKDSVDFAGESA